MFTGIIQNQAKVTAAHKTKKGLKLSFQFQNPEKKAVQLGESIAINGVCLTVAKINKNGFSADVIVPTLEATTFSSLKLNDTVNLERSLKIGDSLGGHVVSGHVHGTAQIKSVRRQGDGWWIRFLATKQLLKSILLKGSVAIDGVSLTVQAVDANSFSVGLIPYTFQHTIFNTKSSGDWVNIETDQKPKPVSSGKSFSKHKKETFQLKQFLKSQGF